MANRDAADELERRQFLGGAGAVALGGLSSVKLFAQSPPATAPGGAGDLLLVNGKTFCQQPAARIAQKRALF